MASRILNRKGRMDRRLEIRTVVLVMVVTCVPALAAVLIIAASSEPDLAELDRVPQPEGAPAVLTWPELCRDRPHALNAAKAVSTGGKVVALGYMMENHRRVRSGDLVSSFDLLPEAGNLLHPAHRLGDQMIEVRLSRGHEMAFASRRLVRVSGILRQRPGDPAEDRALYILEESEAWLIQRADIGRYYK
jgi:hypothetical protein